MNLYEVRNFNMSKEKTSLLDLIGPLFKRLNLLERGNDKLSLSNLAVFVCVIKVAVAPAVSIPEIGALLLSLLNYGHKRYESNKAAKAELEAQAKVDSEQHNLIKEQSEALKTLEAKVNDQQKVIDEAKSVMTAQKLNAGLKRTQL